MFRYHYLCNQTVMENGTLVKVDCKPELSDLDTFYVPSRPEETTFECVTNSTDEYVSRGYIICLTNVSVVANVKSGLE